ncbi:hypothetical protein L873DRAFT_1632258, partial [Choiromyces venosus 120613-1]
LLLLDGFGSHGTKQFIDFGDEHQIVIFCLPPHTSYLLQPLDVVVFQPYKHYHAEAVEAPTCTGCGEDFNKEEFLNQIHSIRQLTFKVSTVQSAFQATGLIPYNPELMLSKLCEVAPTPINHEISVPASLARIPLKIRSLQTQGEELLDDAKDLP